MDSFASQTPTEETPITSNEGAPSASSNGAPVANYAAGKVSTSSQYFDLAPCTITIHPPGNQPGYNISILSEAIVGPYTRSRALAHQRAFRTGMKREQRLVEKKMEKGRAEYNRRHRYIHNLLHWIRVRKTDQQNSDSPDSYTAGISAGESELADLGVRLRETRADYAGLRVQWVSLKKLIEMNVLVREGQMEALRLLLELADWERAKRQLRLLLEEVEKRS